MCLSVSGCMDGWLDRQMGKQEDDCNMIPPRTCI